MQFLVPRGTISTICLRSSGGSPELVVVLFVVEADAVPSTWWEEIKLVLPEIQMQFLKEMGKETTVSVPRVFTNWCSITNDSSIPM
ncbi:hypothetical protein OUZ56_026975 [Daphnia magna]|uniref:Uncharacterized protein n=1 Tax=Daphnia magna TaxID=35525 RepID=A0ABQ9ZND6_9CRUS|nr:hypothetical protein OUZ56_026975 [Daphnia magna]